MEVTERLTLLDITFDKDETIHVTYSKEFLGAEGQVVGQGMGPTVMTYKPGDDVSEADPKVQALAKASWTDAVVGAFKQAANIKT